MFKNLYKVCAAALLTLGLFSCQEQELVQPYALLAESSLTFAAQGAEAQVLTIASEENWVVDVDQDWISIDVTSGSGTVYANVSVTDNVDANGVLAAPRQGKITIAATRGNYSIETIIYQKGDTYLEAEEYTVSALAALANTEELQQIPVKVKDAVVVAVADEGFVISDGSANVLVSGAREVAVGNKVNLNGQKVTVGGLPVLLVDEVLANDKGTEVTYPTATDISANLDSYTAAKSEYVSVSGTLVDNTILNIAGATKSVTAYKSGALAEFNIHKVTVNGYYAGNVNGAPTIVIASVKDNGVDTEFGSPFPFNDDFSWLDPLVEQAIAAGIKVNDSVGEVTSSADGAQNIYTKFGSIPVVETIRAKGYKDLNPGQEAIYLQQGYLKYGKGKCQSGLTLPFLKIEGTQDIAVSFRWCAHMGGSGEVDGTKLVVAITGPGTIEGEIESEKVPGQKLSKEISHTQEMNKMFWNDAMVIIKGATRATNITIRPCDEQFGSVEAPQDGYYRYYIDDISVVNAADAVQSRITVTGVENGLITFEGTPEGPATFNVTAEKDYKVIAGAKWFSVDVTEGAGGEEQTVTVTCEQSELSESRKGTITIKSGTSTEIINIVQSAAGQTLAPFMSIVGGNSGQVNFEEGSFDIEVQSNVDFEFSSDASWVTVEAAPETRALVDYKVLTVNYQANAAEEERVAHIRIFNAEKNVETVYTLTQDAFVSGVLFQDDFTWMSELISEYNAANATPVGNTVRDGLANQNAPNMGTAEPFKSKFLPLFTEKGYALAGTLNTYYAQDAYLKFSKTKDNSGNALVITAPFASVEGVMDAKVEFDWAAMIQNDGAIDATVLLVRIEGDGTFANGTKYSEPLHHNQKTGEMFWNHVSVPVFGVSANTKLTIVRDKCVNTETGEYDFVTNNGAGRWFIDNIRISALEKTLLFYDSFDGQTADVQLNAGYVKSYSGEGVNDVTYTAGNHCQFKTTYAQGSTTSKGNVYVQYDNELWPELGQGTPGMHLYPDQGTFAEGEVWFQINDIELLSNKTIALGMGVFFNGTKDQMNNQEPAEQLIPLFYKFDNQTEWTKMEDVNYNYNWQWHTFNDITVPDGANKVSFRIEPVATNYFRVDDITIIGKK